MRTEIETRTGKLIMEIYIWRSYPLFEKKIGDQRYEMTLDLKVLLT